MFAEFDCIPLSSIFNECPCGFSLNRSFCLCLPVVHRFTFVYFFSLFTEFRLCLSVFDLLFLFRPLFVVLLFAFCAW